PGGRHRGVLLRPAKDRALVDLEHAGDILRREVQRLRGLDPLSSRETSRRAHGAAHSSSPASCWARSKSVSTSTTRSALSASFRSASATLTDMAPVATLAPSPWRYS